MKKRTISILICGTLMLAPITTILASENVNASTIGLSSRSSIEKADMIVDSKFYGSNGTVKNGYKTYRTVQAAVDSVPSNNSRDVVIYIKNGTYHEKITVNKPYINFIGENQKLTKLTYNVAAGSKNGNSTYGTSGSASLSVTGNAKGFSLANLTVENAFDEAANPSIKSTQAVALKNEADQSMFVNCRFIGNQDTLYAGRGKQYYYNCYIGGDVDFIFGGATAYFDKCEIKSLDRAGIWPKGFIAAPSTPASSKYGFVMANCKLTSNLSQGGSVYLGRPWHAGQGNNVNSSVVFLNCEMGAHICSEGWTSMESDLPKNNRMYEYGSTGKGAIKSSTRPVLSYSKAQEYSKDKVLSGWNTTDKAIKLNNFKL